MEMAAFILVLLTTVFVPSTKSAARVLLKDSTSRTEQAGSYTPPYAATGSSMDDSTMQAPYASGTQTDRYPQSYPSAEGPDSDASTSSSAHQMGIYSPPVSYYPPPVSYYPPPFSSYYPPPYSAGYPPPYSTGYPPPYSAGYPPPYYSYPPPSR